jgi:hypothetical protein
VGGESARLAGAVARCSQDVRSGLADNGKALGKRRVSPISPLMTATVVASIRISNA